VADPHRIVDMIPPKLRLITTRLKPYKPKWAVYFLILQIML